MTLQTIGRYEIRSELGRGGMATVYKAYDPLFEREVALKVLPREMLHDPQFRVRFEREAKTIASLEHPAIVPVYDVGEEDGQPYFVMRYMTGGSLQERIAQGQISLQESARIFSKIAPALDEAHAKGIIHRDLKPGNILFDRTGEPYISDFGIAKITQTQGAATVTGGAIVGTPAYMSPEQAQGEPVDGRSDIYAMGVILYEMLTGVQPYQATTPMAVVVKHITDPIPHILDHNPNLPIDIEPVIEKAMAKDRAQRFSTTEELATALVAVARGESGEQAIKTVSMHATMVAAAKTHMTAGKTQVGARQASAPSSKPGRSPLVKVSIGVAGLLFLCLLGVALMGVFDICPPAGTWLQPPWCEASTISAQATVTPTRPLADVSPTKTLEPPTSTLEPPTATSEPVVIVVTETPPLPPTATEAPSRPVIGGADQIAFIANNEVWLMNMDGSELTQLTTDGLPKSDLQWIPGTENLVYISLTNVKIVEAETRRSDTILSFPAAKFLDTFSISPDGTQVAISLNREIYIVPFDLEQFKTVRGKSQLIAMNGCVPYTGETQAAVPLEELRWSNDGKIVAWSLSVIGQSGKPEDVIRIVDISTCDPYRLTKLDEFPGTRFTPEGFVTNGNIPDFDWDGENLFVFNTYHRNDGWGFLYTYNRDLRQGIQENPIASTKSHCCYRDVRWSPDRTYLIFAFQNKDVLGSEAQIFYIPANAISSGIEFQPIPMPEGFFKNPKEAPQFALHPAG